MYKKKIVRISIIVIIVLIAAIFLGKGFTKNNHVDLGDFTISEDGKEIRFSIHTSPYFEEHVRGFSCASDGEEAYYLDFYNTFGLDFPWGAKTEFVLTLDANDREIYFNRVNGGYELVLIKDGEGGTWRRPIAD